MVFIQIANFEYQMKLERLPRDLMITFL